jgi:hypothetical protein
LTAETKATIDRLGPVKFVVGPDSVHHLFLGELVVATKVYSIGINPPLPPGAEFHRAYPNAQLLTVEEVVEKKKDENLNWHGCQYRVKFFECMIDMATQTGVILIESPSLASRMK